jgi:uracil phosphoribosyltransferase
MLHVIDHPLIHQELSMARAPKTSSSDFRAAVRRIACLMTPRVCENLPIIPQEVQTPLETMSGKVLQRNITLVPILRAGLGFLDGFLDLIPHASVVHLGIKRNEITLAAETYYAKLPHDWDQREVIVLDPMLATGGSAISAIEQLKKAGAQNLRFACLVAAPEGIHAFESQHPDVPIYTAALDRCLSPSGYILPGLGDAGDRLFDT